MVIGGSFSKNDLENSSSHEELSPLIDDKNEQLPLTENFLRKRSSTSSSKSPDGKGTPLDEKLGSSVTGSKATKNSAERKLHTDGGTAFSFSPNGNRESKDTTAIDIELQDNYLKTSSNRASDLAGILNRSNTNEVPNIIVTMPSKEHHEPQGLERGNSLRGISSQFFDICKKESIDQGISFLYKNNYLYDVLLLQNEEDQDTPLHVAIKKGQIDLAKEILRILEKSYNLDDFYKYKHFSYNRNPLSKVINTKNREGKDVITLVIEGNNPECISAAFKYLTREDINRRKDIKSGYTPLHEAVRLKSSNAIEKLLESEHVEVELLDKESYEAYDYVCDKETTELFIKYYNNKIDNLCERLEDNNRELAQTVHKLSKRKSIFAYSAAISFCTLLIGAIVNMAIGHEPPVNYVIGALSILASPPGLIVYLIHRTNEKLLRHEEENPSLKKEFNSCIERRRKLKDKLDHFQERESHRAMSERLFSMSSELQDYRKENEKLKEKLSCLEERTSSRGGAVSTQLEVPTVDNVFASPSTKI